MDHEPVDISRTRHLTGVAKTLRRVYAPAAEPNAAIVRALDILARCEAARHTGATRLAPAA